MEKLGIVVDLVVFKISFTSYGNIFSVFDCGIHLDLRQLEVTYLSLVEVVFDVLVIVWGGEAHLLR